VGGMQSGITVLRETPGVISTVQLKRLMVELKEKRPDICIRFRMLGEMWAQNFMRVLQITDKGIVLNDEVLNKLIYITNLTNVMQCELDNRFQNFQPFYHYEVVPDRE
jgi:hypothetical protein